MALWRRKQRFVDAALSTVSVSNEPFSAVSFDPEHGLPPQVADEGERLEESLYVVPIGSSPGSSAEATKTAVELDEERAKETKITERAEKVAVSAIPIGDGPAQADKHAERPRGNGELKDPALNIRKRLRDKFAKREQDTPGYLLEWRRGLKGRPAQVFIGFLPEVTKKDAIAFAIGVAQRNCTNLVNTSYAVYRHNTGWAYEVHEGGPRRGYLSCVLRIFDEQSGGPITEESAVLIETAQRIVRIERTQTGLTAFLMPEAYQGAQTDWLEPGARLRPAAPMRGWLVGFGAAVFITGFVTLITVLATRPAPLPLNAPARAAVPYEDLPISEWKPLVATYEQGTVIKALRWEDGHWFIQTARTMSNGKTKTSTTARSKPESPTVDTHK